MKVSNWNWNEMIVGLGQKDWWEFVTYKKFWLTKSRLEIDKWLDLNMDKLDTIGELKLCEFTYGHNRGMLSRMTKDCEQWKWEQIRDFEQQTSRNQLCRFYAQKVSARKPAKNRTKPFVMNKQMLGINARNKCWEQMKGTNSMNKWSVKAYGLPLPI